MRCVNERERTIWRFVTVKNILTLVFHASLLLLTRGSTATLTMLWRNSWSKNRTDALKTHFNLLNGLHNFFNWFETSYQVNKRHKGRCTVKTIRGNPLSLKIMVRPSYGFCARAERLQMTSWQPYWCFKTMTRRPCWLTKPILLEFNPFLM